ncbi:MAG: metallophosphoesterase [Caulobacteraceae bacterium]|nr:metallophosphoesterase [Caulobacteraceae bacterium]
MRSTRAAAAALAGLCVFVAGPARAEQRPEQHLEQHPELRAWVEMTKAGAQVRVETADAHCPTVQLDGRATDMKLRADPEPGFNLSVCELDIPAGTRLASVAGESLPLPQGPPQRILIFGDTGCRLKGELVQDCNDPKAWPFADVARRAAARKPDLVIHVGDYDYRETSCPEGRAGCAGSPYGDRWATWKADFFDPARPLLAAAPWVFVRGNHESCTRGGKGWFRQLDAGPKPLTCPAASAPFAVDLGGLSLYVLDSADADDRDPSPDGVATLAAQLDALKPALARQPGWIVTHRPIWALTPVARLWPFGPLDLGLNLTEQAAVRGRDLSAVQMVVSGHVHQFAAYDFGGQRPSQLVAGTGGDVGEPADAPVIRTDRVKLDGVKADRLTFDRYGYLLLDRAGADWVGAFWDLNDRVVAACRLHERRLSCAPGAAER